MPDEPRQLLAAHQEQLVRALTLGAPKPEGFNPAALHLAWDSLLKKRMRTVAKVWPRLADALGPQFRSRFQEYATHHEHPSDGAFADGRRFARWLNRQHGLTDAARVEVVRIQLLDGIPLRFFRFKDSGRIGLGLRIGRHIHIRLGPTVKWLRQ